MERPPKGQLTEKMLSLNKHFLKMSLTSGSLWSKRKTKINREKPGGVSAYWRVSRTLVQGSDGTHR